MRILAAPNGNTCCSFRDDHVEMAVEVSPTYQEAYFEYLYSFTTALTLPLPWMYYRIGYYVIPGRGGCVMMRRVGCRPAPITAGHSPIFEVPLLHMYHGGTVCSYGRDTPFLHSLEQIATAGIAAYWDSRFSYHQNVLASHRFLGYSNSVGFDRRRPHKGFERWAALSLEEVCANPLPWGNHHSFSCAKLTSDFNRTAEEIDFL